MISLSRARRTIATIALWALCTGVPAAEHLRVITLSPHGADLVAAAGGVSLLVGVAAFTDPLPVARQPPVVGDAYGLDRERILQLRPDVAVAWHGGNRETDIAWLGQQGIRVYVSGPRQLADIPREIREIGELLGTGEAADGAADRLDARITGLHGHAAGATEVSYVFQVWHRPPMTFGGDALLTRSLRGCDARNVFDDVPAETFTPDPETLARLASDVEIIADDLGDVPPLTSAARTLRVSADALYQPSPSFVEAVARLCERLHTDRGRGTR
jgi:ABC-type Fe3+-hydroxamate transport system substrate-binding protein